MKNEKRIVGKSLNVDFRESYGLSGVTIKIDLAGLQALKTQAKVLGVTHKGLQDAKEGRELKEQARRALDVIEAQKCLLDKLTADVTLPEEAYSEIFEPAEEKVDADKKEAKQIV